MTRLTDALQALHITGKVDLGGCWITVAGLRCSVHVVEDHEGRFLTWCDHPAGQVVEVFGDPKQAIRSGLARAEGVGTAHVDDALP